MHLVVLQQGPVLPPAVTRCHGSPKSRLPAVNPILPPNTAADRHPAARYFFLCPCIPAPNLATAGPTLAYTRSFSLAWVMNHQDGSDENMGWLDRISFFLSLLFLLFLRRAWDRLGVGGFKAHRWHLAWHNTLRGYGKMVGKRGLSAS